MELLNQVAPYGDGTRTCTQSYGGAIYIQDASLTIVDSTFFKNYYNKTAAAWGLGGAINVNKSSDISIVGTTFEDNFGFFGGALFLENVNQEKVAIDNCTFTKNIALQGGAINIQTDDVSNIKINNAKFIENGVYSTGTGTTWNDGGAGGAIQAANGKINMTLTNSEFINNTVTSPNAAGLGGAAYIYGNLVIDNCKFNENSAARGSALLVGGEGTTTSISNTEFDGNNASEYSAIYSFYNNLTISNVNFTNNNAPAQAAVMFYGGLPNTKLTVVNSRFENNKANSSAAGAVYSSDGNTEIKNSEFINNEATVGNGGAMFFYSSTGDHSLNVADSLFKGNKAGNTGGAILANNGNVDINNVTFTENSASNDVVLYMLEKMLLLVLQVQHLKKIPLKMELLYIIKVI